MVSTLFLAGGIISSCVAWAVCALRPRLFWYVVVAGAVGVAGQKVLGGYAIIDEAVAIFAVIGVLFAIFAGRKLIVHHEKSVWMQLHLWCFAAFTLYMAFEAVRGGINEGDIRMIRWVAYYLLLLILAVLSSKRMIPFPSSYRLALVTALSGLAYGTMYLVHGVTAEYVRGIGRFTPSTEWGGPAYAVFPFLAVFPAALLLLRGTNRKGQLAGLLCFALAPFIAFFYDSRALWSLWIGFLGMSMFLLPLKKTIAFAVPIGLALLLFVASGYAGEATTKAGAAFTEVFVKNVRVLSLVGNTDKLQGVTREQLPELYRFLNIPMAIMAVNDQWETFLFGYGLHGSRVAAEPFRREVFGPYVPDYTRYFGSSPVRGTGSTELLMDTGWTGLLLLLALMGFGMWQILSICKGRVRILMAVAFGLSCLWWVVSSLEDTLLFMLFLLPSGFFVRLGNQKNQ